MARRPDPSPFGSRQKDTPDFAAFMLMTGDNTATWTERVGSGRLRPELFGMLRAFRSTKMRLIVEAAALVIGVVMMFVLPLVGLVILTLAVVTGIFDLLLFARLRRRVREAWEDLALESD